MWVRGRNARKHFWGVEKKNYFVQKFVGNIVKKLAIFSLNFGGRGIGSSACASGWVQTFHLSRGNSSDIIGALGFFHYHSITS